MEQGGKSPSAEEDKTQRNKIFNGRKDIPLHSLLLEHVLVSKMINDSTILPQSFSLEQREPQLFQIFKYERNNEPVFLKRIHINSINYLFFM